MENIQVGLVIDYQNIHLTAHSLFAREKAKEDSLIHPFLLAETVLRRRAKSREPINLTFEVSEVRVFRGLPSNKQEPFQYAKNLSQKSEWTKNSRIIVEYLPLKYRNQQGLPPQEKGIDVLTALNFVSMVQSGDFGLVILLTHDTDLIPALQMATLSRNVKIESAGWSGLNKLRLKEVKLFHTFLTKDDFENSIDHKNYNNRNR